MAVVGFRHDFESCEACGRTLLQGESGSVYVSARGESAYACDLCAPRLRREGWVHEAAASELLLDPVRPRRPKASPWRRALGLEPPEPRAETTEDPIEDAPAERRQEGGERRPEIAPAAEQVTAAPERAEPRAPAPPARIEPAPLPEDPVLLAAIERFNDSDASRKVAGLNRSLGEPSVSVVPDDDDSSEVRITVAWEISWYQWVVDLDRAARPPRQVGRGEEMSELSMDWRRWNAHARRDGHLRLGAAAAATRG